MTPLDHDPPGTRAPSHHPRRRTFRPNPQGQLHPISIRLDQYTHPIRPAATLTQTTSETSETRS